MMIHPFSNQCHESNCYVAQAGDTLYAISRFYNVSMDDLIEANPNIEPDLITPGQVICIPLAPHLAAPSMNCPIGATTYKVQKGDTFYTIAKRSKMHLSALLKANPNINPDALLVGQSLCIPMISCIYTSKEYGIKLLYPYRWSKIDNKRFEGIDGFFQVSAISSDATLEEVCSSEAHHKLKPYGTHPIISDTTVNNREARFIMPSTDQPMEMRGQSAIIVKYDKPLELVGTEYQYLIILTNKNHLRDIANSVEFLGA